MEAKDTVIRCEDKCPDAGTTWCNDCDYGAAFEEGAKAQQEYSKTKEGHEAISYLEGYQIGIKKVVELALESITEELEYPSDMPSELWDKLNGNQANTQKAMRGTVRLTKNGITERLLSKLKEWNLDG